jgi:enoyl-CoA hydratase
MTDESTALTRIEINEGVGELVINRPERRNALTSDTISELQAGLDRLIADDAVRVILIRGEGGAFCAGNDLKEPRADDHGDRWRRLHAALHASPKPTVGALERFAIAGGSALALACDFLVAGETAYIHTSEVKMGMSAPINAVWLELKHSVATAYRFAVAGTRVHGPELATLGVAVNAVPDAEVLAAARAFAARLTVNDPAAVARVRRTLLTLRGVEGAQAFEDRVLAAQRAAAAD